MVLNQIPRVLNMIKKLTLIMKKEHEIMIKATKIKGRKTNRHCNFCDYDGHIESKRFKNVEAL